MAVTPPGTFPGRFSACQHQPHGVWWRACRIGAGSCPLWKMSSGTKEPASRQSRSCFAVIKRPFNGFHLRDAGVLPHLTPSTPYTPVCPIHAWIPGLLTSSDQHSSPFRSTTSGDLISNKLASSTAVRLLPDASSSHLLYLFLMVCLMFVRSFTPSLVVQKLIL